MEGEEEMEWRWTSNWSWKRMRKRKMEEVRPNTSLYKTLIPLPFAVVGEEKEEKK